MKCGNDARARALCSVSVCDAVLRVRACALSAETQASAEMRASVRGEGCACARVPRREGNHVVIMWKDEKMKDTLSVFFECT